MTAVHLPPTHASTPEIAVACARQRADVYRMRHAVYARELGQHAQNAEGALQDELDDFNTYLVAVVEGRVAGFVSITPPGRRYSIDRHLAPEALPFARDAGLHEVRLLTVAPEHRGRRLAPLLMYAALRWVRAHGGTRVVALGRSEILGLYLGVGLQRTGRVVRSGAVTYHLLHAETGALLADAARRRRVLSRLERGVRWRLPVPFADAPPCYHGGAFFSAVGEEFDAIERHERIINADVLDAWFPPAPGVLAALREHLSWLARTSPPTDCGGLVRVVARARGVEPACILPGGGSSDLIFLALPRWLSRESRVLVLDPMYGEYAHVLEQVVRCRVDRLLLRREEGYGLDPDRLAERLKRGCYDLVVLVNPNSPTGRHVPRAALEAALAEAPRGTRVWIDETYVEYVGGSESLERFAAGREGVVVCKSMSKVYALSGLRVGYLCASPATLAELRPYSPPWAVSLPAQVAAVRALEDPEYYAARWRETHALRAGLAEALERLGVEVLPGVANFLLCHLPEGGPDAAEVVARAREEGLFVRDVGTMGTRLGGRALRIATKDAETNRRMARILARALETAPRA